MQEPQEISCKQIKNRSSASHGILPLFSKPISFSLSVLACILAVPVARVSNFQGTDLWLAL